MKQKLLSFLVLCSLLIGVAHAQNRTVTGRVTSASDGSPLPGVTVSVRGTSQATQTQNDGTYSITAGQGTVLVFTSVGYAEQTAPVGSSNTIDIVLRSYDEAIEDVVVVGYGTGRNVANLTASVATVTAKQIQDRPRANVLESLQGQVAGLQVFTSSGEPSETQSIRLRGVGSLGASSTPLFVLDGVPVEHGSIISMNPEDFESVTVLKDAAATSIYGSRAANGVIFFTSKKGRVGETASIKYRGQYGWSNLAQTDMQRNVLSGQELLDFWVETGYRSQAQADQLRQDYPNDFEWFDYYYKKDRPMQQHDLNVTGGSQNTRYYISAGFYDEEGLMYRSGFDRITLRSNIDTRLNSWARVGLNLAGATDRRQTNGWGANDTNGGLALLAPGFYNPYREDGSEYYGEMIPGWNRFAPNYLADMFPSEGNRNAFTPTAYIEIQPIDGLTFRTQAGLDYNYTRWTWGRMPSHAANPGNGQSNEEFASNMTKTWTNTLEYNWTIQDRHSFSALAGQEVIDFDNEVFSGTSSGQTDDRLTLLPAGPNQRNIDQSKFEWAFSSLFGSFAYDFDKKYFLTMSLREDRSSRFGRDREGAMFWSVGGMWDVAKESFMESTTDWIQDLQLRASYGTTGNAAIGNYQHLATVGTGIYGGGTAWGIASPGNPLLGWERQGMYNVGISGTMFNSLMFNIEHYKKTTTDMLLSVPYPYTTGFSDIYDNIGSLTNSGIDVELSYRFDIGDNAFIMPRVTYNYNQNKVTELFQGRDHWIVPNTGIAYVVGQPVVFFDAIRANVNPETGLQQWYVPGENIMETTMDPDNVTTSFGAHLQQNLGLPRYAPHVGGFGLDAAYKGFSLSTQFAFAKDKYLLNNDRYFYENPASFAGFNQSRTVLDYWKEPGDVAQFPRYGQVNQFDSGLIEDASFLRLKNLTVAYTLPRNVLERSNFFKSARIFYIGRNLWTTTKYLGPDPEVDSNLAMGRNPNTKQSTFGLELIF